MVSFSSSYHITLSHHLKTTLCWYYNKNLSQMCTKSRLELDMEWKIGNKHFQNHIECCWLVVVLSLGYK